MKLTLSSLFLVSLLLPSALQASERIQLKMPTSLLLEPRGDARVALTVNDVTSATLLEDRGDWVRLQTATGEGWVRRGDVMFLPDVATTTTTRRVVMLSSPTVLSYEPVTGSRVISNLVAGGPVSLIEDKGDWYRVLTTSGEGWVQRDYLQLSSTGAPRIVRVLKATSLTDQPLASAHVLGSLGVGSTVSVMETSGDWYRVTSDSGNGWVQRVYLDNPPGSSKLVRVNVPTAVLRSPLASSERIDTLVVGAPVSVLEENGDWVRVRTRTGDGWVQRTYLDTTGDTPRYVTVTTSSRLAREPSTTTQYVSDVYTGSPVVLLEDRGDWVKVRTSTGDGWMRRTDLRFDDAFMQR